MRPKMLAAGEAWNRISDEIYDLEQQFDGMTPGTTIVQPGISASAFATALEQETHGIHFAGENVWYGRFEDADLMVQAAVEEGTGQAAMVSRFEMDLNQVLAGEDTDYGVRVGYTTTLMRHLGMNDLPVVMPSSVARKIVTGKDGQRATISKEQVLSLNRVLVDPVAVFDSKDGDGSLIFLTDMRDADGNPIMAVIRPDQVFKRYQVNLTTSMYGKNNPRWFVYQVIDGRLRYYQKQKLNEWQRIVGVQFPKMMPTHSASKKKILTDADIVKPRLFRSATGRARAVTIGGKSYFFLDRYDNASQARADIREEAGHRLINEMAGAEWGKIGFLAYRGKWKSVIREIERNYGLKLGTPEFNHELIAKAFRDGRHNVTIWRRMLDAVVSAFRGVARKAGWNLTLSDAEIRYRLNSWLSAKVKGYGTRPVSMASVNAARSEADPEIDRLESEADRNIKDLGYLPGAKPGTRSKLNRRQWVQVRTEAFKRWFGDWAGVEAKKTLVEPSPIDTDFNPAFHDDIKAALVAAEKEYAALQEQTKNGGFAAKTMDGHLVGFSGRGFDKVSYHAADRRNIAILANAKAIIENGVHLYSLPPNAPMQGVKMFHYYATKVSFGGERGTAYVLTEIVEIGRAHV